MNLKFSTFLIGPGTNYHITEIQGLDKAAIRTSSVINSGRDGGSVTQQFLGMRVVTVTGVIKSPDVSTHRTDRSSLDTALPIGSDIPVYITLFDGAQVLINARVTDLKMDYKVLGRHSDYKIELTAGDPLFYDQSAGAQSANIIHALSGGYVFPYILPVTWQDGAAPTIVTNSGNALVYPTITLTGQASNPVVTNNLTGELFKINVNMVGGDVMVIDMLNRTVKLNGASIIANMDTSSTWWGLQVGSNPILLNSSISSDPVTGVIAWRSGYTAV